MGYVYLPDDLRNLLMSNERVIWYDKPVFKPLVLSSLFFMLFGIPFLLFPLLFFTSVPILDIGFLMFFVFWYSIVSFIAFGPFIYSFLSWKNMVYMLTNKRIIIRRGVIGIDYDILNVENIQQVILNVGFWDKIFGTGTLTVYSIGVKPLSLVAVKEPTKVLRIIQEASNYDKKSQ